MNVGSTPIALNQSRRLTFEPLRTEGGKRIQADTCVFTRFHLFLFEMYVHEEKENLHKNKQTRSKAETYIYLL